MAKGPDVTSKSDCGTFRLARGIDHKDARPRRPLSEAVAQRFYHGKRASKKKMFRLRASFSAKSLRERTSLSEKDERSRDARRSWNLCTSVSIVLEELFKERLDIDTWSYLAPAYLSFLGFSLPSYLILYISIFNGQTCSSRHYSVGRWLGSRQQQQ